MHLSSSDVCSFSQDLASDGNRRPNARGQFGYYIVILNTIMLNLIIMYFSFYIIYNIIYNTKDNIKYEI